jgi:hypothetical protein
MPLLLCPELTGFRGRYREIRGIEKEIWEILNECKADEMAKHLLKHT